MGQALSLTSNSLVTNSILFLARKSSLALNKLMPGWTHNRIDNLLFIPKSTNKKLIKIPQEIDQFSLNTHDGKVNVYQIGKGPVVIFVHGWGGGTHQFFPLMRGLSQCGFTALAFDHLGHGQSDRKSVTLHQSISTTNFVLNYARKKSGEGVSAVVGHSTGCISIANARQSQIKHIPLFLIAPIFNYKMFFLKKLVGLNLHPEVIKKYASRFSKLYKSDYEKFELARNLTNYADVCVIAHDKADSESPISASVDFCKKNPLTKLVVTNKVDHVRIINSVSVWHELKSHLNYEDTTNNFPQKIP